jgi:hypothetical protein
MVCPTATVPTLATKQTTTSTPETDLVRRCSLAFSRSPLSPHSTITADKAEKYPFFARDMVAFLVNITLHRSRNLDGGIPLHVT